MFSSLFPGKTPTNNEPKFNEDQKLAINELNAKIKVLDENKTKLNTILNLVKSIKIGNIDEKLSGAINIFDMSIINEFALSSTNNFKESLLNKKYITTGKKTQNGTLTDNLDDTKYYVQVTEIKQYQPELVYTIANKGDPGAKLGSEWKSQIGGKSKTSRKMKSKSTSKSRKTKSRRIHKK